MLHEMPLTVARWFRDRNITLPYWFSRFVCDNCHIDRVWIGDDEQAVTAEAEEARVIHGTGCHKP